MEMILKYLHALMTNCPYALFGIFILVLYIFVVKVLCILNIECLIIIMCTENNRFI